MDIRETLCEMVDADLLFLTEREYDSAIVGLICHNGPIRVVYDREKIIQLLIEQSRPAWQQLPQLVSEEQLRAEAEEHFEFNIEGAYVGPQTPLFLLTINPNEAQEP